nr:aldolase/citrate lyase family protein [Sphingomonas sp. Y57]
MPNPLLETLRRGGSVSSLWSVTGSIAAAEIMAAARPAALVFDDQHGLWDRQTLFAGIAVVRDRATPLVRTVDGSPAAVGGALDSGALGVIVPMIETADQAAAAVAAAKYPPAGNRSGGGIRPLLDFPAYAATASRDILVGMMIETARGVENAAAIAKTPGVDLVFVGSGDLSLSLGTFPDFGPRHEDAVQAVLAACKDAKVACGIYCLDPREARPRIAEGFQFLFLGSDNDLLRKAAAAALATSRQV